MVPAVLMVRGFFNGCASKIVDHVPVPLRTIAVVPAIGPEPEKDDEIARLPPV